METPQRDREKRFHVLLTERRFHAPGDGHWIPTLSRLLEPQGVTAHVALNGRDAISLAENEPIHAAVVDLGLPVEAPGDASSGASLSGLSVVRLLHRLPKRPAVVALRGPARSTRQRERLLHEALRLGAFSVIDKPVEVERLLAIFRRLIDRHYQGGWPADPEPGSDDASSGRERIV